MKKTIRFIPVLIIVVLALVITSCAPGNEKFDADPAGFWAGLWHGFISLVTFIISLFNDKVNIYEISNSGWAYNLGFILGVMIFYGGSSKGTCKWK
jgi:hypothetical protein